MAEGDSGYSDCSNDFMGNCINGQTACTGSSCGTGNGCEEEHQSLRLDGAIPRGGEILVEAPPVCRLPGVIVEA